MKTNKTENTLGDYKLGFKLGTGTDATCYLATKNGKHYCMKVISLESKKRMEKKQRVLKEIQILEQLQDNQNVIQLIEAFGICQQGEEELICIVTEVMPMNLANYLKMNGGKISEEKCKIICKQLLKALHNAHQKFIIHNDLKLENIMIDPKNLKIKLIDFGMSAFCKNEHEIKYCKKYK